MASVKGLSEDCHLDMQYAPDGRLFISFRDTTHDSQTQGDWVGWVGTYDDIVEGRQGQYRVRLLDNKHRWDCAYPGVEILHDGGVVRTDRLAVEELTLEPDLVGQPHLGVQPIRPDIFDDGWPERGPP